MRTQRGVPPESAGRVAQLITAALIMGVVMFAGVAVTVQGGQPARPGPLDAIAMGISGLLLPLSWVVPGLLRKSATSRLTVEEFEDLPGTLAPIYVQTSIVRNALLEGGAFLNLIAYLIGGNMLNLGVAGAMALSMAAMFPSQMAFESWVEQVRRERP